MQRQLSDKEIEADLDTFNGLVKTLPEDRRKAVERMLEDIGAIFCTAPASTRTEFHSCYAGGLLRHSLNVTKYLNRLAKGFCPSRYSDSQLITVGLFHDLGKAADQYGKPVYVSNPSDWHREKLGALYEINKDVLKMAVCDRSLFLLQMYGVVLTQEEYLAIRLADGQNVRENEGYRYQEPELAILLATANTLAERSEKASG